MYHVHVRSMKLVHHVHARSMLRGHAVFWRHAQTVALATTLPKNEASQRICMLCAKACIFHFYSAVPLGRPIGHLCSFSSFSSNSGYDAPVVCPQSLQSIVAIATGVLRGPGWAIFGASVPTQSAVCPRFPFFAEVQGTLFLAFVQFTKRGFLATTFFGARRVLWSRTPRHHETSSSVLSSCPTPQNQTGTGPALWSCWVPLNVFRCRIPALFPAANAFGPFKKP